jgi:hypothetical protein
MANFIVDLVKMEATALVSVICFRIFSLGYSTAWLVYLLFPFAGLPFTYCFSFIFSSSNSAQTMTMFLNFGTILFATTLVFYMRWMAAWERMADGLNFWLRILPPYCLGEAVNFDANMKALAEFRANTEGNARNLDDDPWIMQNTLGNVVWLIIHFVFWFGVLIAIESGLGKVLGRRCTKNCNPMMLPMNESDE